MPLPPLTPSTLKIYIEHAASFVKRLEPILVSKEICGTILKALALAEDHFIKSRTPEEKIAFILSHRLKTRDEIEALPLKIKDAQCNEIIMAQLRLERDETFIRCKRLESTRAEILHTNSSSLEAIDVFLKSISSDLSAFEAEEVPELEELFHIITLLQHETEEFKKDSRSIESNFIAIQYIREGEALLEKMKPLLETNSEFSDIMKSLDKAKEALTTTRTVEEQIRFIHQNKLKTEDEVQEMLRKKQKKQIESIVGTELLRLRNEAFDTCYRLALYRSKTIRETAAPLWKEIKSFRINVSNLSGSPGAQLSFSFSRSESTLWEEPERTAGVDLYSFHSDLSKELKERLTALSLDVKSLTAAINFPNLARDSLTIDIRLDIEGRELHKSSEDLVRLIKSVFYTKAELESAMEELRISVADATSSAARPK